MSVLYFAKGSNLWTGRLRQYVPSAQPLSSTATPWSMDTVRFWIDLIWLGRRMFLQRPSELVPTSVLASKENQFSTCGRSRKLRRAVSVASYACELFERPLRGTQ